MSNDRQQRAARAEQMRKDRQKAEKRQRNLITVAIVAVVIVLVGAAGFAITQTVQQNETNDQVIPPKGITEGLGVVYTPEGAGASAADQKKDPVRVTLYEDLQCPVCKQFEAAFGPQLESMVKSGDIEIEYRLLSFLDERGSQNEYSSRAGSAVICAFENGTQEQFKAVHDELYANQPEEGTAGPENPALAKVVADAGIEGADTCVRSGRYAPWLNETANKAAQDAKVSGTPTVQVDGKTVEGQGGGVPQIQQIMTAIEAAQKA